MRSTPVPMKPLAALSCALLVSACASKGPPLTAFPPRADLAAPAKPELSVEAVSSAAALAEHNSAVERWGDDLKAQVDRLCRWAKANGMPDAPC